MYEILMHRLQRKFRVTLECRKLTCSHIIESQFFSIFNENKDVDC